jgi:hypothetical protein
MILVSHDTIVVFRVCVTLRNATIMHNGLTLFSARGSFASLDANMIVAQLLRCPAV